jgi:chemotaxis protein histidine kinase CheA
MNNLQKDFLHRSRANLENLSASAKENLSPELLREIFRALHTIKGTAQTFGFAASAQLAHELENLLSAAGNNDVFSNADFKNTLTEGFALLIKSFGEAGDFETPNVFLEKIRRLAPDSTALENTFFSQIPDEISRQLSEYEKNAFATAQRAGKNIFCVRADFDLAVFGEEFKDLRESLSANGEIIATLPNPNSAARNKIGFLIYFAGQESEKLRANLQNFSVETIGQTASFPDDSDGVLTRIAAHAKDLAQRLGKEVEILISADKIELSSEKLKIVFDALLHLVRNAVDHAVEKPEERRAKGKERRGKIEILLKAAENGFELSVRDDGKGIDLEKIRAKALERNLLPDAQILTGTEMLDLIFLPEFSTRERVSEISGRGVGLDAVKNLIENAGGKISVESVQDAGTTFEIFLPKEF